MSGNICIFVVTMSKRIIDDAVKLLKDAGWQPMVCDTAVPYFDNGVPAGIPQDLGEYSGESVMLPKEIMGYEPMIMIRVRGESMCGAGIENGDMVTLLLDTNVEDGDIVVAWLDGEATLKVFYRDEAGEVEDPEGDSTENGGGENQNGGNTSGGGTNSGDNTNPGGGTDDNGGGEFGS